LTKLALIVDDSKTARQVLSSKLSNYGIAVVTMDSAAAAIDYLYENTPDAIFLDYEMPGMDGFQALKIIKSNPHTALIPVTMYTSKPEGLAVGQARALGAVGVLPKQLEPHDLEEILTSLHLMPEQESLTHGFEDSELQDEEIIEKSSNIHSIDEHGRKKIAPVDLVSLPMDDFQHVGNGDDSLRQYIRRQQSQSEERIAEMIEKHFAVLQGELSEVEAEQQESGSLARHSHWLGILSLLFLLTGFILAYYFLAYSPAAPQNIYSSQSEFSKEIKGLINAQADKIEFLIENLNEGVYNSKAENVLPIPLKLIEWAVNQRTEFAYGESPFSDQRALWVSEMVAQLKEAGFRGTIELRATYGNFCLQKSDKGELSIAKVELDVKECLFAADIAGNNEGLNDQSVAFANYLNVEMGRSDGELEILVSSSGFNDTLTNYPALYDVHTAGEWNKVATQNQRIRVSLFFNQEY
jgi:CheY-like chemotaxis protein